MTEFDKLAELLDDSLRGGGSFNTGDMAEYLLKNGVTTRRWIPVQDSLPTADGCYEVTIKGSKGKRYVSVCNFTVNAKEHNWADNKNVVAWRERAEPYSG